VYLRVCMCACVHLRAFIYASVCSRRQESVFFVHWCICMPTSVCIGNTNKSTRQYSRPLFIFQDDHVVMCAFVTPFLQYFEKLLCRVCAHTSLPRDSADISLISSTILVCIGYTLALPSIFPTTCGIGAALGVGRG
jgi:hypothetical protein